MNDLKKNIFKKRTSDVVIPPSFFTFSGIKGNVFCNNGTIDINNTSPITVYRESPTLNVGDILYEDSSLTTFVHISGFKHGSTIYEVNAGQIDLIYSFGSIC